MIKWFNYFRFSNLSSLIDVKWDEVILNIKELAATFNLDARNVALEQMACVVSCIIIFHILSIKEDFLKSLLARTDYELFEEGLLSKIGTTKKNLNQFVEELISEDKKSSNIIETV